MTLTQNNLQFQDLGLIDYDEAFAYQMRLHQLIVQGEKPPTILLLEHDPVITISKRKYAINNLLSTNNELDLLNIQIRQTNRGGDITYHGPGQLVAYPLLRLKDLNLTVTGYMRWLEEMIIKTLKYFNIQAQRQTKLTGIWVSQPNELPAKICAMGVRLRKGVTLHGLALNVNPNMDHFKTIMPCGLTGRQVVSLEQKMGPKCPTMLDVKNRLQKVFATAFTEQITQTQKNSMPK